MRCDLLPKVSWESRYELLCHVRSEWRTHKRKRLMTQELLTRSSIFNLRRQYQSSGCHDNLFSFPHPVCFESSETNLTQPETHTNLNGFIRHGLFSTRVLSHTRSTPKEHKSLDRLRLPVLNLIYQMRNDEIGIVWWGPEHDEIELELCDFDKQILTHLDVIPSPGIFRRDCESRKQRQRTECC